MVREPAAGQEHPGRGRRGSWGTGGPQAAAANGPLCRPPENEGSASLVVTKRCQYSAHGPITQRSLNCHRTGPKVESTCQHEIAHSNISIYFKVTLIKVAAHASILWGSPPTEPRPIIKPMARDSTGRRAARVSPAGAIGPDRGHPRPALHCTQFLTSCRPDGGNMLPVTALTAPLQQPHFIHPWCRTGTRRGLV